jgi:hypothetical protein
VNLTVKLEKATVAGKPVWIASATQFEFLDKSGMVAQTVK